MTDYYRNLFRFIRLMSPNNENPNKLAFVKVGSDDYNLKISGYGLVVA